ncbi:MAG: tetratricopeptide repeat protein [Deinococcales bacterium]
MRWFIPHDRATGETFIGLGRIHLVWQNFEEASRFFNDAIDIFDVIEHPLTRQELIIFFSQNTPSSRTKVPST